MKQNLVIIFFILGLLSLMSYAITKDQYWLFGAIIQFQLAQFNKD